jgi:hypothetical protein
MSNILNRLACAAVAMVAGTVPMAAGAQVQTFYVDCGLGQSIGSALMQGDSRKPMVILVRGSCTENTLIARDDVTLQGQAGAGVAAASQSAPAITVRGTRVVIDSLKVSGGLSAILVTGTHDVLIDKSEIRNAAQNGLQVENGFVTVRDSAIASNGQAGIFLRGSRARLEGNQITGNAGAGISAHQRSVASAANNTITGNSAQGVYLFNGSTLALAGGRIESNASHGIELSADSQANVSGVTISSNNAGIHATFSQVTVANVSLVNNRSSGALLKASRGDFTNTIVTGNGQSGINGVTGPTLVVTGGSISGNGYRGVSIAHNGTVGISGALVQGNASAGIFLSFGTKLMFVDAPTDATGNGSWGLDCMDPESSYTGPLTVGSTISPSCTGYN